MRKATGVGAVLVVALVAGLVLAPRAARAQGAPSPPANLAASAFSATQIDLTWTDTSADEDGFRVERSDGGGAFAPLGTVGANATAFSDTTAVADVLYTYQVLAYSAAGDSNPSNAVTAFSADTVNPPPPTLSFPSNGDTVGTHNVQFQWNPVADLSGTSYHIVVADVSGAPVVWDVGGVSGSSITLQLYDGIYAWNCYATDGAGNIGAVSETWYFTVLAVDYAPPDLSITYPNGGEELQGGSYATITWYALDDLTSTPDLAIALFFSPDGGATWSSIGSASGNEGALRWQVPNISSDLCLVRVTATDINGMVGLDATDAPFTIVSTSSSDNSVSVTEPNGGESWRRGSSHVITWDPGSGSGDVTIRLFKGRTPVRTIARSTPNDGAFKWKVPAACGTSGKYKIRVTNLADPAAARDASDDFFSIR